MTNQTQYRTSSGDYTVLFRSNKKFLVCNARTGLALNTCSSLVDAVRVADEHAACTKEKKRKVAILRAALVL